MLQKLRDTEYQLDETETQLNISMREATEEVLNLLHDTAVSDCYQAEAATRTLIELEQEREELKTFIEDLDSAPTAKVSTSLSDV